MGLFHKICLVLPRVILRYFSIAPFKLKQVYPVHNWGSDLGNLLQGGEAYVKFFAENAHFQERSAETSSHSILRCAIFAYLLAEESNYTSNAK